MLVPSYPWWIPQGQVHKSLLPDCIVRGEYPVYCSWMSSRRMAGNTHTDDTGEAWIWDIWSRKEALKLIDRCPKQSNPSPDNWPTFCFMSSLIILGALLAFLCFCWMFTELQIIYLNLGPLLCSNSQALEDVNVYYGALFFHWWITLLYFQESGL